MSELITHITVVTDLTERQHSILSKANVDIAETLRRGGEALLYKILSNLTTIPYENS